VDSLKEKLLGTETLVSNYLKRLQTWRSDKTTQVEPFVAIFS
jgi:hypothetical protein